MDAQDAPSFSNQSGDKELHDSESEARIDEAGEAQKCVNAIVSDREEPGHLTASDAFGIEKQLDESPREVQPQLHVAFKAAAAESDELDSEKLGSKQSETESTNDEANSKATDETARRPFAYATADEILAKYLGQPSVTESTVNYPIFSSRYSTILGTTTLPSYVDAKFSVGGSTYSRPIATSEAERVTLPSYSNEVDRLLKSHPENDAAGSERRITPKASPSSRLPTKLNVETTKLLARLTEVSQRPSLTGLCDARVAEWLRSLELANVEHYIRLFAEHEVDYSSLQLLTVSSLREMGIKAIGPLNKIAYAIRDLRRVAPVVPKPKQTNTGAGASTPRAANGTTHSTSAPALKNKEEVKKIGVPAVTGDSSAPSSSRGVKDALQSAFITNVFTKVRLGAPDTSALPSAAAATAASRPRDGVTVSVGAEKSEKASATAAVHLRQPNSGRKSDLKLDLRKLDGTQARTESARKAADTKQKDSKTTYSGRHVGVGKDESKKQNSAASAKLEPRTAASTSRSAPAPASGSATSAKRSVAASARGRGSARQGPAPRSRSVATARQMDEATRSRLSAQPLTRELRMLERRVAQLSSNADAIVSSRQRSKSGGDADEKRTDGAADGGKTHRVAAQTAPKEADGEQVSFSAGASPVRRAAPRSSISDRLVNLTEMHALVERLQKQLATVQSRLGVAQPLSSSRVTKKDKEPTSIAAPTTAEPAVAAPASAPAPVLASKPKPKPPASVKRATPKPVANGNGQPHGKTESSAKSTTVVAPAANVAKTPRVAAKQSENAPRGGIELCVVESLTPTKMRFADESVRLFAHRLVGEGSFTRVYRGTFQQRAVVLKCLKRKPATARELAYFADECSKLRQLTTTAVTDASVEPAHPNIAPVLGYVEFLDSAPRSTRERTFAFVQNFAEGGSLHELLHSRFADIPLSHIVYYRLARDIATGMNWLHAHAPDPILHLNLTSRNVLLDGNMRARIADFGFNRLRHAGPLFSSNEMQLINGRENGASSARSTARSSLSAQSARGDRCNGVCSVNYLPPELLLRSGDAEFEIDPTGTRVVPVEPQESGRGGHDVLTTKVDVFSFGMLLYEMLTRAVPFAGRSHLQIADALYRRERPHLSGALSAADLERLISACWHQVSVNRPSFTEILYRLERLALPGKWYQLVQKTPNVSMYALLNTTALSRRDLVKSPRRDAIPTAMPSYTFRTVVRYVGECLQQTAKSNARNTKFDDLPVTQFETLIECTDYEIDFLASQLTAAIEKGQLLEEQPATTKANPGNSVNTDSNAGEQQPLTGAPTIRELTAATLNANHMVAANDRC